MQCERMTPDPVGAADIAERLGVKPVTVRAWQARRTNFPKPRWQVNGQATWDWADVRNWAAEARPGSLEVAGL